MDQLNLTGANLTNGSTFGLDASSSLSWRPGLLVPAVLLSLCFLVGSVGNLAVIILKPNWQNMSALTQSLMLNLALSDLLCLCTAPFWIYNMLLSWTLGTVTCKIVGFFAYCSVYCSMLTVTALSVQRYLQVKLQQRGLQFKKRLLVLLWLSSMSLSIPSLVFGQVQHARCTEIYASSVQRVAVMLTECFVGFGSFSVMACSYIFLNKKISQAVFFHNASTSRLFISIIVTFFILWMPYFFCNLVSVGGILSKHEGIMHFRDKSVYFFISVTFINSSINPLFYAFALGVCRKKINANRNDRSETSDTNA